MGGFWPKEGPYSLTRRVLNWHLFLLNVEAPSPQDLNSNPRPQAGSCFINDGLFDTFGIYPFLSILFYFPSSSYYYFTLYIANILIFLRKVSIPCSPLRLQKWSPTNEQVYTLKWRASWVWGNNIAPACLSKYYSCIEMSPFCCCLTCMALSSKMSAEFIWYWIMP